MELARKQFDDADANNDGRLDAAEFAVMRAAGIQKAIERGYLTEDRPDAAAELYAILNDINKDQDGVTWEEYLGATGNMMAIMVQKRAEMMGN